MPSGKNHDRITWICFPIVFTVCLLTTQNLPIAIITGICFVFAGLMFGPDLDIHSVQIKRWGWLQFIWLPYQKNLKHRSIFSHGFLIGTIGRILYFAIVIFLLAIFLVTIAQIIFGFPWHWQEFLTKLFSQIFVEYRTLSIFVFIGLELGAMSHYLADGIASSFKKNDRKKLKARKSQQKNTRRKSNARKPKPKPKRQRVKRKN